MHAEALARGGYATSDEGLGRPFVFALGLHVLLVLLLWLSSWLTWNHDLSAAGNGTAIEATMDTSAAENRAVQRALKQEPEPLPQPQPVEQAAQEETVPPPQPLPEPRPQDAPTPQQVQAQERIPVPDTKDQDEARADAISQEKARQEQEAKRRQEQIDLTERKRVEEAENQRRLAAQQAETDKARIAEQERQKKLEAIRAERAKLQRQTSLAEQRLRQVADARAAQASSDAASSAGASAPAGQGGNDAGLLAKYVAAIQQAVSNQWTRPESVPLGTRCRVIIRQLPGGNVMSAEVQPGCPMDQAGQDSLERAVLKAQPLPYRGFETVFNRQLNFNFVAQDR